MTGSNMSNRRAILILLTRMTYPCPTDRPTRVEACEGEGPALHPLHVDRRRITRWYSGPAVCANEGPTSGGERQHVRRPADHVGRLFGSLVKPLHIRWGNAGQANGAVRLLPAAHGGIHACRSRLIRVLVKPPDDLALYAENVRIHGHTLRIRVPTVLRVYRDLVFGAIPLEPLHHEVAVDR